MTKCTDIRCPMQIGYKVGECDHKDCPYRTAPITNADRIRSMTDEELAELLSVGKGTFDCFECLEFGDGGCSVKCEEQCLKWLQQPAKEA